MTDCYRKYELKYTLSFPNSLLVIISAEKQTRIVTYSTNILKPLTQAPVLHIKNMKKVDHGNYIQETNFTVHGRNWPLGSLSTFDVLTTSKYTVQFHQYPLTSKDLGNKNSKRSIVSYHKNMFFPLLDLTKCMWSIRESTRGSKIQFFVRQILHRVNHQVFC